MGANTRKHWQTSGKLSHHWLNVCSSVRTPGYVYTFATAQLGKHVLAATSHFEPREIERERKGSNKNPLRAFTNREPKSKRKKSRRYSLYLFVRNNSFACITMCAPLALHHYSRSESFEMGDEWLDRERVDVVLVTALANHTAARGTRCARTNDVMYSPIHDSYVQPQ